MFASQYRALRSRESVPVLCYQPSAPELLAMARICNLQEKFTDRPDKVGHH